MLQLSNHIEYLLSMHDCVIVPGLGGFVMQHIPARFSDDMQTILPPSKEISFNSNLIHDDGLLAESFMKSRKITYSDANLIIENEVKAIYNTLNSYRSVSLGGLGSLMRNDAGKLIFEPNAKHNLYVQMFGMMPFNMKRLDQIQPQSEDRNVPVFTSASVPNPDVFYIPISRKFIRRGAYAAIAIFAMMLISTPVSQVDTPVNYASLIASELITNQAATPLLNIINSADSVVSENEAHVLPVQADTTQATSVNQVHPETKIFAPNQKRYFVIVASFPNEELAKIHLKKVRSGGFSNADLINKDHKVRVYIDSFANKTDGEACVNSLRAQYDQFSDAWLFSARI